MLPSPLQTTIRKIASRALVRANLRAESSSNVDTKYYYPSNYSEESMTALKARARPARHELPPELSPTGKLVYLYLTQRGSATAEELKADLGVPQIRLYPALSALEREDLVDRSGDEFGLPR